MALIDDQKVNAIKSGIILLGWKIDDVCPNGIPDIISMLSTDVISAEANTIKGYNDDYDAYVVIVNAASTAADLITALGNYISGYDKGDLLKNSLGGGAIVP